MIIKHPTYTAELVTSKCSIELSLNGVPTFNSFEEATMSVDWNLNLLILENGLQNLSLKIMPLKGEKTIRRNAIARIKIVVREAIEEYIPQEIISEEIELNFKDRKILPYYIHKMSFPVSLLPYRLEGWKNSIDLSKQDKKTLFSEVIEWNKKLLDIHRNLDFENYLKIFASKNKEVYEALYLSNEEIDLEKKSIFNPNDRGLVSLPNDLYKLELYAENRLVSVLLPYELPGFTYEPKEKTEDSIGFSQNIYFHRKKEGEPLEIIR